MPVQRIVLIVDISGENQNGSCSRVVNPSDVDGIKVYSSGVTRDFGNIVRTIKQAVLISQGRDEEAKTEIGTADPYEGLTLIERKIAEISAEEAAGGPTRDGH